MTLHELVSRLQAIRQTKTRLNEEYDRVQAEIVGMIQAGGRTTASFPDGISVRLQESFRIKVLDREGAVKWLLDHGFALDICSISGGLLNKQSRQHPARYLEFLRRGFVMATPVMQVRIKEPEGQVAKDLIAAQRRAHGTPEVS